MNGCPQPGSAGIHSRRYYEEDGVCSWCGEKNTGAWRAFDSAAVVVGQRRTP